MTAAAASPVLAYTTLEHVKVARPVDRLAHVAELCRGLTVLDIGCMDETAAAKWDTEHWLHGRIAVTARKVRGVDNSPTVPADGLATGPDARIDRGDAFDPRLPDLDDAEIDIIVAGELIEHLEAPLEFLRAMKRRFPGKRLVLTTPNGASFANGLLGTIGREAQHHDHLMVSTYKTLNTLCLRSGCRQWRITPYRFYATELLLSVSGLRRLAVRFVEAGIRAVERVVPLRSFGYVVEITL